MLQEYVGIALVMGQNQKFTHENDRSRSKFAGIPHSQKEVCLSCSFLVSCLFHVSAGNFIINIYYKLLL